MKRLALGAAVALAAVAGTARAETVAFSRAPLAVPSAETPNAPGSLRLPAPLEVPPALPQQRSYGELQRLWGRAGAAYGIPWAVLAAINKIESNFGRNMGPSSAGAIGWMQFLPSTWLRWGLDASGDGVADPWNPDDAVFAAARYLAAAGGRTDLPRAVFAYNHAQWYVDEVLALAGQLGRLGPGGTVFALDRIGAGVDEAAREVDDVERELAALQRRDRPLAARQAALAALAESAPLFSDRLDARKRAVQLGARRDALTAAARRLEARLAGAEARLSAARERSAAAAFAPAADALLTAPAADGTYVFPVGGGPGLVSVAHTHHDYPAADIAAPAGSPVYALAAVVVENAWHSPEARCGIGLTMRAEDGLVWTYCHLGYLDETIQVGSFLPAGAPIGLVGSTGHSTGPHLHLQLQPATAYPQEQPWFAAFAGSAFTWQDGPGGQTPGRVRTHPVFSVVAAGEAEDVVVFTR
jgi:murein DD-endopeptidase MepM/ murein hydrolase activator NlpD